MDGNKSIVHWSLSQMPKKLLYIGPWHHIQVVQHFPHTKEFIFIDTQPRSEFDKQHTFDPCFYRRRFYQRLRHIWSQYGFRLLRTTVIDPTYHATLGYHVHPQYHVNPTVLHFVNPVSNQTIRYYISTNIKFNMCPRLEHEIKETDGLIVSGYFPDKIVLSYLPTGTPYTLYCYTATSYDYDYAKGHTIIDVLYVNSLDFTFVIVEKETGKRLHACQSVHDVAVFLRKEH